MKRRSTIAVDDFLHKLAKRGFNGKFHRGNENPRVVIRTKRSTHAGMLRCFIGSPLGRGDDELRCDG